MQSRGELQPYFYIIYYYHLIDEGVLKRGAKSYMYKGTKEKFCFQCKVAQNCTLLYLFINFVLSIKVRTKPSGHYQVPLLCFR